jgi:fermentation-respiration switch protein FrsA (DUF1100 family)
MTDTSRIDYSTLDRPEVLAYLFHPRPEAPGASVRTSAGSDGTTAKKDIMITVENGIAIGARFHVAHPSGGNIVFFHGNGEIVADYDELATVYNRMGINFLPVDYRGYGRSNGKPTVAAMMADCHVIFEYIRKWLAENEYSGPVILMGRSLGSASVLELAAAYAHSVDGLIVESGFAYAAPLLSLLGINIEALGFREEKGFRNIDKIKTFNKPTLIIHAEFDHIIPFSEGRALFEACPSTEKNILKIPGANHNDIFMRGLQEYMTSIKVLVDKAIAVMQY